MPLAFTSLKVFESSRIRRTAAANTIDLAVICHVGTQGYHQLVWASVDAYIRWLRYPISPYVGASLRRGQHPYEDRTCPQAAALSCVESWTTKRLHIISQFAKQVLEDDMIIQQQRYVVYAREGDSTRSSVAKGLDHIMTVTFHFRGWCPKMAAILQQKWLRTEQIWQTRIRRLTHDIHTDTVAWLQDTHVWDSTRHSLESLCMNKHPVRDLCFWTRFEFKK